MAATRLQAPRAEIITYLHLRVKEAIFNFGAQHKKAPAKIIFFRDGLSEGEFEEVGKKEIMAIKGLSVDADL